MIKCLKSERLVKPKMPNLAENHTSHKKRVWEYQINELMKTKTVLQGNLCNMFAVLMSLYDSDTKNEVKSMTEYSSIEAKLDTMALLGLSKKLVYTGGSYDLNKSHNKALVHMNFMNLHQERFQDIQDFQDQYTAKKKVYSALGYILEDVKWMQGHTQGKRRDRP